MKPQALPQITETEILGQCLEALELLGLVPERQNTGVGTYENEDGTARRVKYGKAGNLDITFAALPDGRACEIEVKRPGKKPTPKQLERIRTILANGGVAFWVNDSRQILDAMPHILRGAWVEEEDDGTFVVTDEPKGDAS